MTTHADGWLNARSALLGLGLSSVLKQETVKRPVTRNIVSQLNSTLKERYRKWTGPPFVFDQDCLVLKCDGFLLGQATHIYVVTHSSILYFDLVFISSLWENNFVLTKAKDRLPSLYS